MTTTMANTTAESDAETAAEWQIVPTIPHPDEDVEEPYTASPGPSAGLTEARAKELARGRNRAGEPSPVVTWRAEPTGRTRPVTDLQGRISDRT